MTKPDAIYARPKSSIAPFDFNSAVVEVFDDMLTRSVPLYHESIRRQVELSAHYYQPGTYLYDLGCSNGNFGLEFIRAMGTLPFKMRAIDNSTPMLDQYRHRLKNVNNKNTEICLASIEDYPLDNASVVVINLTLQFSSSAQRLQLLQRIYDALVPGGILLLSEKIIHQDDHLNQLQQKWYYKFKKENGYSQLEISQKREALENVLIPDSIELHLQRLNQVGFHQIDVWLKWFNFVSILCVKQ